MAKTLFRKGFASCFPQPRGGSGEPSDHRGHPVEGALVADRGLFNLGWTRARLGYSFRRYLQPPAFASMIGDVQGQLQPAPNSQLVENDPQIILHHLLGGADALADFPVGHAFPDQGRHFNFPGG